PYPYTTLFRSWAPEKINPTGAGIVPVTRFISVGAPRSPARPAGRYCDGDRYDDLQRTRHAALRCDRGRTHVDHRAHARRVRFHAAAADSGASGEPARAGRPAVTAARRSSGRTDLHVQGEGSRADRVRVGAQ